MSTINGAALVGAFVIYVAVAFVPSAKEPPTN
jgi:hypothetical protein